MLRAAATAVANASDGAQQPGPAADGGEPSSAARSKAEPSRSVIVPGGGGGWGRRLPPSASTGGWHLCRRSFPVLTLLTGGRPVSLGAVSSGFLLGGA